MGFFNFGKKKEEAKVEAVIANAPVNKEVHNTGINLSKEKAISSLNLRKETFSISLRKNNMENVMARVAVVMDKSGSMSSLYNKGKVQDVLERLLPIAIKFDDNGELDMWLFSTSAKRTEGITENDFYQYVEREVLGKKENDFWGGTNYAPAINDVVNKYVKEEPSNVPCYVIFITDGENFDKDEARRAIVEASKYNIFWQFVGIGNENFKFLKSLDNMDGRVVDNANFFAINDLDNIADEKLYDMLLAEYPEWEKKAKEIGIIK